MGRIKCRIVCLFLFCFLFNFTARSQDIISVREMFYRSSKFAVSADSLFKKYENVENPEDTFSIAYKGMSQLMLSFHSNNPYTKLKYFVKGKEYLEAAIRKDSKNIEYRFLRLCVQLNTPSFLGYHENINEDKLVIFTGIKTLDDKDLLKRIANYTSNAKKLSKEEKIKIKQALFENKKYVVF